jgi:bifunctional non-homologous end joining protein LigD
VLPEIQSAKLARSLQPFDDPNWLFELKHDGFRSLAYLENGHCRLVSRRRNHYKSFEVLREALSRLRAQSAILDGEIVALDSSGVSQFKELLYRRGRAVLFAFDLVWLNGVDLRQTPLIERKKKLRRLIEGSECSEIIYAQHVERDGRLLFQEVCERNLEGGLFANGGWASIRSMVGSRLRIRTIRRLRDGTRCLRRFTNDGRVEKFFRPKHRECGIVWR